MIKGYKAFNNDLKCRGFQYEIGHTYEIDEEPICCERGFHFCEKLVDCFEYYPFNDKTRIAEIEAIGDVVRDGIKSCTNKIKISRELTWDEVLTLCNTGDCNTGNRNTGNWNTGNRNTGDWNTGNRNTGDCNTGDWNTGDWNTGNRNTGNRNTGNRNTGNRNTGDWNTGDWNSTDYSSGVFNTEESKILMFNKPSEWSYMDWINSDARYLLNQIPKDVVEWVFSSDMTDEEKKKYPEHKTIGGYLKILGESESAQIWWNGLSEEGRECIRSLPNFDKEIFENITGIKM